MNKTLLVADELAEILRVDKQRIYELVRTNQIPVVRIGERQYRFSPQAIEEWLAKGGSKEAKENVEKTIHFQA